MAATLGLVPDSRLSHVVPEKLRLLVTITFSLLVTSGPGLSQHPGGVIADVKVIRHHGIV